MAKDPNRLLDSLISKMSAAKFREYESDKKTIEPTVTVETRSAGYLVKVSYGGLFVKMAVTKFGVTETEGSQGHRHWLDQVFKIRKSVDKGE